MADPIKEAALPPGMVSFEDYMRQRGIAPGGLIARGYQHLTEEYVNPLVSRLIEGVGRSQFGGIEGAPLMSLPSIAEQPENLRAVSETLARNVVPQTLPELGMAVGTGGAAGLGARLGLRGFKAAGSRILGGTVGGTAGALVSGDDALESAVHSLLGTSVGEAVGAGWGFLRKSRPGGRTAIEANELDQQAEVIATYVPGIRQATTPSDMKRLIRSGKLLDRIGDRFGASVVEADAVIGGQRLNVPALGGPPMSPSAATRLLTNHGYGSQAIPAGQAINLPGDIAAILSPLGPLTAQQAGQALHAAGYGRRLLTLSQAVEELKALGYAGYAGTKELRPERTYAGRAAREQWQQAIGEIRGELRRLNPTGEAVAIFEEGRRTYAVARTFHDILNQEGTWKGNPDLVGVNTNNIRRLFERRYSKLLASMDPEDLAAVELVLYRHAPFGSRDLTGRGPDTLTAAPASFMRSGAGSGTTIALPLRSVLPGAGDLRTGMSPTALRPGVQTGLDLLSQRLYNLSGLSQQK